MMKNIQLLTLVLALDLKVKKNDRKGNYELYFFALKKNSFSLQDKQSNF